MGTMENLPICRICLISDVRMHDVLDNKLREFYEKITTVPFKSHDSRPSLVCYMCYARLQKCYQFVTKCLETETMFTRMLSEDNAITLNKIQQNLVPFNSFRALVQIDAFDPDYIEDRIITQPLSYILQANPTSKIKEEVSDELIVTLDPLENGNQNPDDEQMQLDSPGVVPTVKMEPESQANNNKKIVNVNNEDTAAGFSKANSVESRDNTDINITVNIIKTEELDDSAKETPTSEAVNNEVTNNNYNQKNIKKCVKKSNGKFKTFFSKYQMLHKCHICMRKFKLKSSLKNHISTHYTSEKIYKCDVCQCEFDNKDLFNEHNCTPVVEEFKCNVCQRKFCNKSNLIKHIRVVHTGEKPYKCEKCQCMFGSKSNLKRHIIKHTAERPYKCDVCQCGFNSSILLKLHLQKHVEKEPYKCGVCQKNFVYLSKLNSHMRIHTGDKPYKCDVCQRRFGTKSNLTSHLLVHTDKKPYVCSVCQWGFTRKCHLINHIRKHGHTTEEYLKSDLKVTN